MEKRGQRTAVGVKEDDSRVAGEGAVLWRGIAYPELDTHVSNACRAAGRRDGKLAGVAARAGDPDGRRGRNQGPSKDVIRTVAQAYIHPSTGRRDDPIEMDGDTGGSGRT